MHLVTQRQTLDNLNLNLNVWKIYLKLLANVLNFQWLAKINSFFYFAISVHEVENIYLNCQNYLFI